MKKQLVSTLLLLCVALAASAHARPLESRDFFKMRSVASPAFSPDGSRIVFAVESNPETGRPYRQLWTVNVGGGQSTRIGGEADRAGSAVFSPDGKWMAFSGRVGSESGLFVANSDGTSPRRVAEPRGTNSPLTFEGASIAWSRDSRRLAYVSAVPGPETDASESSDPIVVTRYLYKPDAGEGMTRFNDNRRRQVFIVDPLTPGATPRQLTQGPLEHHSIDWSPDGTEIVATSNRDFDPDYFYNQDIVAISVETGAIRRVTTTESAEYQPKWSPDGKRIAFLGTKRGLTDLETTMEDNHVYVMNADGTGRRELGAGVDNRQSGHVFSADGAWVYFTAQNRGSVRLHRAEVATGKTETVVDEPGSVGGFSVAKDGSIAYAFQGARDLSQLFYRRNDGPAPMRKGIPAGARVIGLGPAQQLTDLNKDVLVGVTIAPVESMTFVSADFKHDIEAFLTKPASWTDATKDAVAKHPMIVMIHGGPHGQQGPSFNFKSQFYASRGYATLQINYRGSSGYGQKFADAVYADQNGQEAMDVLYGTSAALRRNPWIDPRRVGVEGGSYGGQLSCWLITQTPMYAAAIPSAAITNIISYNYMTYYNQYEEMEWGMRPHQGNLMDVLWERSALKHVAKAKTPTMMVHGENDNDVPIAEAEQFFVALRDVGVDAIMVRYPREGHGLREPKHVVDLMDRSVAWYEKHFAKR